MFLLQLEPYIFKSITEYCLVLFVNINKNILKQKIIEKSIIKKKELLKIVNKQIRDQFKEI